MWCTLPALATVSDKSMSSLILAIAPAIHGSYVYVPKYLGIYLCPSIFSTESIRGVRSHLFDVNFPYVYTWRLMGCPGVLQE